MRFLRLAICLTALCLVARTQTQTLTPAVVPQRQDTLMVTGHWEPVAFEDLDRSVNQYPLKQATLLFGSLSDAFSLDSSVFVQSRGANGIQADFSIRGSSFEQTLVLLNGTRLSDAQSAHYNSDLPVPLDAVDHVEVLRGSGSTLYGSEAVGGVINIITRRQSTADPISLILRAGYGTFGTNEQSGLLSFAESRLSQQFSFERELSDGFADDREYRNLALSSESWYRSQLGLTRVFLGIDDRPFGANQFYGNFNSWERTKTWVANLTQDIGKRTLVTVGYRRHTDLYVLLRNDPEFYTNRHIDDTWDVAIRRHDPIAHSAQIFYGAEGLSDHVESNNIGVHSRRQAAVYGSLDLRSIRRAFLSVGAREEVYGPGARAILIPSVSGGFWISEKFKLRGAISRAFRLPSFTDLYYTDPANIGNPALKAETATSYEAGVDYEPGSRWRLSATLFDRQERNDIDYVRSNPNAIYQAINFDRLNFVGIEAGLFFSFGTSHSLGLEYSALHGAQSALAGYQSKYVFNYPVQQAVVSWQKSSPRGWLARAKVGVTDQYARPAYTLLDASIAWNRSRIHPYVRATNLLNSDYQPVYGVIMPGRAFLGGIELRLLGKTY